MKVTGFTPVNELPRYVKMLLYGQAGAGKTRFCADAPNPYWFDYERSTETLRHWPEFANIPVKTPKTVEELTDAIKACIKDPDVETVVIDSMTTVHDYYLRKRVEERASKGGKDPYELYDSDYKYATQVFTKLFGFLQEAPINVVLIGHERKEHTVTERGQPAMLTGIFPDITPRLQQAVTRLVNVVAYMEAEPSSQKGLTRKLYLNRTKIIEAKNRLNRQEIYLANPTWNELFSHE